MNFTLKRLFLLVIITFSILTSVYSVNANPVCCYTGGSLQVDVSGSSSCEAKGGIDLGEIRQGSCDYLESEQVSCRYYTGQNTCTNTLGAGYVIYDIPEVLEFIESETNRDINELCAGGLVPFDSTCATTSNQNPGTDEPGSSSGDDPDSSDNDNPLDPGNLPDGESGIDYEILSNTCESTGGGFLGFFAQKSVCESVVFNTEVGGNPCIYNPYAGGKFSSQLHYDYPSAVGEFEEPACIAKLEISACSDYKTQVNCETNSAYGQDTFSSKSPLLEQGCTWIPPQNYSSSLQNQATGMCVSKAVQSNVDYNVRNYNQRKNILENPSFRAGLENWTTTGVLSQTSTDFDFAAVELKSGEVVEQIISQINYGETYTPKFFIKFASSPEFPAVKVEEIREGGVVETYQLSPVVRPQLEENSIYKEVIYSGISISQQAEKIKLSITAQSDVIIDLVSLESPLQDTISSAASSGIFIPTQLVPKDASYCSTCYVKDGINTCTQEKSNSLGACSYMVSGPQEPYSSELQGYTGRSENEYLGSETTLVPWKSQSIANSELFCEMYTREEACVDPQNHVNSHYGDLHMYSESTLCAWDSSIGCFKDSNDDGTPDVKKSTIYSSNMSSAEMVSFYSPLTNYNYQGDNSMPSDFASACDSVPPVVYTYLSAKNASGEIITFEGTTSNDLLGEANLVVQTMDYFPDEYACSNYPLVEPQTYVVINSSSNAPKYEVNGFSTTIYDLKDFYGEDDIEVTEPVSFSIEVFDQSGNYGLTKSMQLTGLDLFSPKIQPLFEVEVLNSNEPFSGSSSQDLNFVTKNYVDKGTQLNYTVQDGGGITSCSYALKGLDGISGNFGELQRVPGDSQNEMSFSINLSSYNYDVELTGGTIQLNLECGDIFGQNTSQIYLLKHLGELYIDSPKTFPQDIRNYNISLMQSSTQGFYNQKDQTFEAYVTRDDITSCTLGEFDLDIISGEYSGFEGVDATFTNKIMGDFSFSEETSEQNLTLSCQTSSSNALEASLYYFYEEETPNLLGYSLSNDINTTMYFNQTWYTITPPSETDIFLDIDGTQSWIHDTYELYLNGELLDASPFTYGVISYEMFQGGHDFTSNALIEGIPYNTNLGSTRSIGEMIQVYDWTIELIDKAGNKANYSMSYYYDYSTPSISFGGDIITQDGTELFTSSKDPLINVSFETPAHRAFTCDIVIEEDGSVIRRDLGNFAESSFSFRLSEFISSVDVSQDNFEMSLECVEETFTQEEPEYSGVPFTFVFDNTPPILKNISLEGGSKRYFGNDRGLEIPSLLDTLQFEFEDTNERGYTCEYQIISPQENYFCDPQTQSRNFNDGSTSQEVDVRLLSGFKPNDRLQSDSTFICSQRTQKFWNEYDAATLVEGTFPTSLEIVASCTDAAGFRTQQVSTAVDIVYSSSSIVDVEFSFEGGLAIPEIIMNSNDVSESLRYIFKSPSGEVVFDSLADSITQENGVSIVGFLSKGIQTDQFLEEEVELTLEVQSNQNMLDTMVVPLLLDFSAPSAHLEVLDNFNGSVDSTQFKVGIEAQDSGISEIDLVEFYVNGELAYSKQFGSYVTSYQQAAPIVIQDSKNVFELSYFFKGVVGESYDLELRVADGAGNFNSTNVSVLISNDVSFNLVDSQSVKLSRDPFVGLTRSTGDGEPLEVSGTISPDATCSIYPFKENELGVADKNVSDTSSFGESFSFDLSQDFIGFSMENAKENSVVLYFECSDSQGDMYQFRRELVRVVGLPDYTLVSSNGFFFNSNSADDYFTEVQIVSVGPFKEISCEYSFQESTYQTSSGISFIEPLSISPQSGTSDLILSCEDIFGVSGPQKSYEFVVLDDAPVEIGDVRLISDVSSQNLGSQNQQAYVSPQTNYAVEFELNKKGVSCSLNIIKGGSFTNRLVGFFDNLFNFGSISIQEGDSAYVYRSLEPLSFDSDSTLKVSCGSGADEKEFDINYLLSQDYDISIS